MPRKKTNGNGHAKPEKGTLQKRKVGRPTAYREEFAAIAAKACETWGATDQELADLFSVSVPTINTWKVKHPKFLASLLIPKEIADARVEKSLYHRAIGYSHDAVKILNTPEGIVKVPYREHFAPETAAMSLWLRNRQPHKWRDVRDVQLEDRRALDDLKAQVMQRLFALKEAGLIDNLDTGTDLAQVGTDVPQGVANRGAGAEEGE